MRKSKNSLILFLLFSMITTFNRANNLSIYTPDSSKAIDRQKIDDVFGLNNINFEKSILWEISGNGLVHTSYLFGTIHKICNNDYFWFPHMDSTLRLSDMLVMEVDMQELKDDFLEGENSLKLIDSFYQVLQEVENTSSDYPELATTDVEPPPSTKLRSDTKKSFDSNIDNIIVMNNYPNISLNPLTLNQIYLIDQLNKEYNQSTQDSLDPEVYTESNYSYCQDSIMSYELELLKLSKSYTIPTDHLESIFDQFRMLIQMSDRNGNEQSYDYENHEIVKREELDEAYKNQDITLLFDIMKRSGLTPSQLKTMLNDRNHNWIGLMQTLMEQKSIFFAVGAGHLGGENGLIQLLRNKGYLVKPITQ